MTDTKDLPEDWWTTDDVAHHLSVTPSTVRAYLARKQMPEPDRRMAECNYGVRPASGIGTRLVPGSSTTVAVGDELADSDVEHHFTRPVDLLDRLLNTVQVQLEHKSAAPAEA